MKPFFIGKVKIASPVVLAPMEAVTNSAFRRVVKPFGAGLVFTEFCSSTGLLHGRDKLWDMVRFHDSERPLAVQIFGSDPNVMSECAKKMEDLGADLLDMNCGCSVPKMEKSNSGAYLTRDMKRLRAVMEAVVKAVKIPVTIKIRKGWDEERVTCFEIARTAEALGFSAVSVHGRTSVQAYSGKADWETIDAVAQSVRIPVIGSGDIASPKEAREKLENTRITAVMVGRAVMGNPWIFSGILSHLRGQEQRPPSAAEKFEVISRHFDTLCGEMAEIEAVREMRRHLTWYIRDLPHAAQYRGNLHILKTQSEVRALLYKLYG